MKCNSNKQRIYWERTRLKSALEGLTQPEKIRYVEKHGEELRNEYCDKICQYRDQCDSRSARL